jgi:hypothetical protein
MLAKRGWESTRASIKSIKIKVSRFLLNTLILFL